MSKEKDLSSLYPSPKSYEELVAERQARELARRPRHVPIKMSSWVTLEIITILITYYLARHLMTNSLSSTSTVMFSVSTSILLGLIMVAILIYLHSLINSLISRILVASTSLFAAILSIAIITSIILITLVQYDNDNTITVLLALLFNFLAIFLAARLIAERRSN